MGGLDAVKDTLYNLQSWLRLQCNALQKKLYIKSSLWNNIKDSFTLNSTLPVMTSSLFVPPLCPLQATTAQCACGCWTTGRACRRSRPTGRSTTRPFMMWPSTLPSRSLPAPAQMHLPRSSSDSAVVILVRQSWLIILNADAGRCRLVWVHPH